MNRYDRYRTHDRSRRWAGHDYGGAGWYFVTICTDRRLHLFGKVRCGIMGLSEAGCIAHACWAAIPDHMPHVHPDAFIVMPNHVHGLIGLRPIVAPLHATADQRVAPFHAATDRDSTAQSGISPRQGSLATVVRSYKAAVTQGVRQIGGTFAWQPRFHDHVVRNAGELQRIRSYIEKNPAVWCEDAFHR